jgi:hypothetical protein
MIRYIYCGPFVPLGCGFLRGNKKEAVNVDSLRVKIDIILYY